MKKLYFLMVIAFAFSIMGGTALAQDIMLNGDLELWDDASTPTSWDKAENISQETTPVHGGTFSAGHTSASGTKDFQQDITGVVGGDNYTISYYFLDNDPNARARIWSYWLSGGSTIDDNGAELRPSTYSEDSPDWQHVTHDLIAPAAADGFRFEVRVYKQDGNSGGIVYYDDFSLTAAGVTPEPTNHPTDFAAAAAGFTINLSWTDAIGAQLPSGYIILASDNNTIAPPVDGTVIPDDLDLSDGSGAVNVGMGLELYTFTSLLANTQYFFEIYPYTNGGASIDYKTDGTIPTAEATIADLSIIETINFDAGWDDWQQISVSGDQEWIIDPTNGVGGTPCAKCSGYDGGANANEDWLISPAMNFDNYTSESLTFFNATGYSGAPLEAMISNDYDGSNPSSATWTTLTYEFSTSFFDWTSSGVIDISGTSGTAVYIAFKYTSDATQAATWEVDDIVITGSSTSTPVNYTVTTVTINNGEQECYNATNTITVAGSGNMVDINSGGEATFIAGQKIIFEPGFNAYTGSVVNAYITTTSDYCSSLPPMAPAPKADLISDDSDDDIDVFGDNSEIRIYPNPTKGEFVIEFLGKETTAEIYLRDLHGRLVEQEKCSKANKVNLDISSFPSGMYIILIKTETEFTTRKIIKTY